MQSTKERQANMEARIILRAARVFEAVEREAAVVFFMGITPLG